MRVYLGTRKAGYKGDKQKGKFREALIKHGPAAKERID